MKEEVKQEPDGLGEASLGTSTQSGTGDVSPNSEGTLISQLQTFMGKNMATMQNVMQLNTTKPSIY